MPTLIKLFPLPIPLNVKNRPLFREYTDLGRTCNLLTYMFVPLLQDTIIQVAVPLTTLNYRPLILVIQFDRLMRKRRSGLISATGQKPTLK